MATEFCGTIAHIVQTGNVFVIGGKTIDGASRLDINFKSGKHEDAVIALHLSVRFDDDIILRNSYLGNGKWLKEEREENIHDYSLNNPLIAGDDFQFYIMIGETSFHIAVNKTPYCTYAFKMPIEKIRTIEVTKDLQNISQMDHRSVYPYAHPPLQYDDIQVAFNNDVPRHFQPGNVIIITGIPSGNSKGRFAIVFTEGETNREALHFNVRFHPEYQIVRNSMNEHNQFGPEERSGNFPFEINQQFKLAIAMTTTEFLFAVNGRFFGTFKYRSHDIFERMNGFKLYTKFGLQMEITSVDHVIMTKLNCREFETYSRPEVEIM